MSKEKIEEMAKELQFDCEHKQERDCFAISCSKCRAEFLYNADYCKVTRCKDCNYCEHCYPTKAKGKEAIEAWYCHFHQRYVRPDDFCGWAKMKGGAE